MAARALVDQREDLLLHGAEDVVLQFVDAELVEVPRVVVRVRVIVDRIAWAADEGQPVRHFQIQTRDERVT